MPLVSLTRATFLNAEFGFFGPHLKTDSALLRVALRPLLQALVKRVEREEQSRCLRLGPCLLARTADKLIDGRH